MAEERVGQYLTAVRLPSAGKTCLWSIRANDGVELGRVSWYPAWRGYNFWPADDATFNAQCLLDLAVFLTRVRDLRNEPEATV